MKFFTPMMILVLFLSSSRILAKVASPTELSPPEDQVNATVLPPSRPVKKAYKRQAREKIKPQKK